MIIMMITFMHFWPVLAMIKCVKMIDKTVEK